MATETGDRTSRVRRGHELDVAKLLAYLHAHATSVPGLEPSVHDELKLRQFSSGQSNPTYLLSLATSKPAADGCGGSELRFVLRKRPDRVKVKSAHAVAREFHVLSVLRDSAVPVPEVYLLCEDESVLGASFYVMQHMRGRIFDDPTLPGLPPRDRRACYRAALRVLAALHAVDWQASPILCQQFRSRRPAASGRDVGFFARMLGRLSEVSDVQAADSEPLPDKAQLVSRLGRVLQKPVGSETDTSHDDAVLIHGDFKIDNLVFANDRCEVVAVLDWELCTVGHRMFDVANCAVAHFMPRVEGAPLQGLLGEDLDALGVPCDAQLAALYGFEAGRRVPDPNWHFYLSFLFFRNAVITQGVASRLARGTASSSFAEVVAALTPLLAEQAAAFLDLHEHHTGGGSHDGGGGGGSDSGGGNRPRAVIFDVGGVLAQSPLPVIRRWEARLALPKHYANVALSDTTSPFVRLERGELSAGLPFFALLAEHFRAPLTQQRFVHEHGSGQLGVAARVATAVERVDSEAVEQLFKQIARTGSAVNYYVLHTAMQAKAAGLRVGLLTNDFSMDCDWLATWATPNDVRRWQAAEEAFAACSHVVLRSSRLGVRKPERSAYDVAVQRLGLLAGHEPACLFVDDLQPNLAGAQAVGLRTLRARQRDSAETTAERIAAALALPQPPTQPLRSAL